MLAIVFCLASNTCRADDLQALIHRMVKYGYAPITGTEWIGDKAALSSYSQLQIVQAIFVEIDIDRGRAGLNRMRDTAARDLFQALELPTTLVCQELDQTQLPRRKVSLIVLLSGSKSPEVTQTLLRQLNDKRMSMYPPGKAELAKPLEFRICDFAINALAENLSTDSSPRVTVFLGYARRDEIIKEVLTELNLAKPKQLAVEQLHYFYPGRSHALKS